MQIAIPALIFLNLFQLLFPIHGLIAAFREFPTSLSTLIAGLIGLGTIAWQTKQGFRNLIASQEHRATLDREARREQAAIQEDLRQREFDRERRTLAAALQGELAALLDAAHRTAQFLRVQSIIYGEWPKSTRSRPVR